MKDRRVMNYMGKVIWQNDFGFMVAKGDGTDEYFSTIENAMAWIDGTLPTTEFQLHGFLSYDALIEADYWNSK